MDRERELVKASAEAYLAVAPIVERYRLTDSEELAVWVSILETFARGVRRAERARALGAEGGK